MNKRNNHLGIISFSLQNKIRLALCILPVFLSSLQLSAQQDPMFSQYMFNKLIVNPGYAGSSNMLNASLAYRQQFIGLAGAPKIQAITIDAPLKNKPMGLGIRAIHESIVATSQTEVTAIYAFHLNVGKGKLSLGAEGGIFNQSTDFTNLRRATQDDNAIPIGKESILVPDAAFGVYYSSEKLYLGGSFKHLLQNELNFSGYSGQDRTIIARLSSHSYVLAGYKLKAQENIQIEPSLLLKYVSGAPMQIDMNLNATFNKMFTIGGTYRTNNAIVFLFQYSFNERIKFGYAYDYLISELSSYGYNTHEIMLSYHIASGKKAPDVEEEEEPDPEIMAASDSLSKDSLPVEDTTEEPEQTLTEEPEPTPTEETEPSSTEEPEPIPTEEPTPTEEPEPIPTEEPEPTLTEEPQPTPSEKPEPTPIKEQKKDGSIDGWKGQKEVSFKIQILVKQEPIFSTPVNFKGMENVEEYKDEGLFKYVVGLAYDYDYAKSVLLNEVKMQGFTDAFIVAFYKGKRISIQEALKLSGE